MSASPPLDSLGRRRSPAAVPGYLAERPPRSKGRRYPPDPPRTEEIIEVMRCCGDGLHGDRAREVGMDDWGFEQLEPWLRARQTMPVGPLFCVINGRTRGRAWHASAARAALRRRAVTAGVRRRFAPHQLRHVHALELLREGVPLNV